MLQSGADQRDSLQVVEAQVQLHQACRPTSSMRQAWWKWKQHKEFIAPWGPCYFHTLICSETVLKATSHLLMHKFREES